MAQSSSSFRRRFSKVAGLAVAGMLVATAQASADDGQILRENAPNAIPESYIVVLEDDSASRAETRSEIASLADEHDADVEHQYLNSVSGFSATMTREEALELSTDPAVAYVQQNRTFTTMATQTPTPSWGLDRIDQRDLPLNNSFTYPNTGAGVTAYIIDTGIRDHPQRLRRARDLGHQHHRRRQQQRLQRARHARGRHGRRRPLRRGQGRQARRREGAQLRRQRHAPRASSPGSTGSPASTPPASPPWRT